MLLSCFREKMPAFDVSNLRLFLFLPHGFWAICNPYCLFCHNIWKLLYIIHKAPPVRAPSASPVLDLSILCQRGNEDCIVGRESSEAEGRRWCAGFERISRGLIEMWSKFEISAKVIMGGYDNHATFPGFVQNNFTPYKAEDGGKFRNYIHVQC